jgi:hypothetical protein
MPTVVSQGMRGSPREANVIGPLSRAMTKDGSRKLLLVRRRSAFVYPWWLHVIDTESPNTHAPLVANATDANGLTGTLGTELGQLTSLQRLQLENGAIGGEIPDIFTLLPDLQILDLDFNFIGGSIPPSIYGLPGLQQLDLNHNRLKGFISTRIGVLGNLDVLSLHNNQMTGTIPREIGNLVLLGKLESRNFDVAQNEKKGTTPDSHKTV